MPGDQQSGGSTGHADHDAAENVSLKGGPAVVHPSGLRGTRGLAIFRAQFWMHCSSYGGRKMDGPSQTLYLPQGMNLIAIYV